MKIKGKVLVAQPIHAHGMKLLEDNVEEVLVASNDSITTLASLLDDSVVGVVVRYNVFSRDLIERAPNLKVIARHGNGIELIDLFAATEHNIMVVNTPDAATIAVAEHVIMMALVLSRKLITAQKALKAGNYNIKNSYEPDDVEGKIMGLIGFGKIAREVATMSKGVSMEVIAYDPYVSEETFVAYSTEMMRSMEEVLKKADFVSLHTPLMESTQRLIGKKQLEMMKPSAYLINCARGEIVDEKALFIALEDNVIAGAGLDVFEKEPPSVDNPLFSLDNCVVTPHSASLTLGGKIKMAVGAAEQLIKVLRGELPEYLVNKQELIK